jgi:hypothetical protein
MIIVIASHRVDGHAAAITQSVTGRQPRHGGGRARVARATGFSGFLSGY